MFRSKPVRILLVLLLLLGGGGIAWSVLTRTQVVRRPAERTLLQADERQKMSGAVYWERKSGKVSFQVQAQYSVESAGEIFTLDKVNLIHYDENGQAANLISGKKAVYRKPEGKVVFTGDVRLKLADGTDVFSEAVSADLDKQTVDISQLFRFKRGEASGEGKNLLYQIPDKLLWITGQFTLNMPTDEGPLLIQAAKAFYDIDVRSVDLEGSASIVGSGREMHSDRIDVQMDEQNRITELTGTGNASLVPQSGKLFSGNQILVKARPAEKRLTQFEVIGNGGRRALYEERDQRGASVLESDRMVGIPAPAAGDKRGALERFEAEGSVSFRSQPLGITRAVSNRAVGRFYAGGSDIQRIDMVGNVSVVRRSTDRRGVQSEDTLTSREVELHFLPNRELQQAKATGTVALKTVAPSSERNITAKDFVLVEYRNNAIERVTSEGEPVLQERSQGSARTARAAKFEASYDAGVLKAIRAEGSAFVEDRRKDGSVARSWSALAVASYENGQAVEIVQEGNVRHLDERPESTVEIRAPYSRYDVREETLAVRGRPLATARYVRPAGQDRKEQNMETSAEAITLRRKSETIAAQGRVQTVFQEQAGLVVVRSGRMEADRKSGWVVYSDNPRITRDSSSIAGQEVRYNEADQQLIVTGKVESTLVAADKTGRKYHVLSDRLVYDRKTAKARYEGDVRVTSTDLAMTAPFLEMIFDAQKIEDLREVVAWGGVVVVQGERKASGPRATYYPDTQKVVMTTG